MKTVRLGVFGAGTMGKEHVSVYSEIPGVEVVGVFSRDRDRARSVARTCGAEAYTDAPSLLRHPNLDAIDVSLPTPVHREHVVPALEAGRHVFCETPLAVRSDEARRMVAAARSAGRLLQVGLLTRSIPEYEFVRDATVSGEYGRLESITTYRRGSYLHPEAPDHKPHYSEPSTELMTFDFDFVRWVMGAPARLAAGMVPLEDGSPGEIAALLSFADGRLATVAVSGCMPLGTPFSLGFQARFAGAVADYRAVFARGPPEVTFTLTTDRRGPRPVRLRPRNPYEVELRRFIECVRGTEDPSLLDAERALEALHLSLATQRALREGSVVALSPSE